MTRVNEKHDVEALEKKLSQMEAKLGNNRSRLFNCFNCLIYLVVITLVLGALSAFWLAKSGLVTVPYLTAKLYTASAPVYLVKPEPVASTSQLVQKILSQAVNKLTGNALTTASINFTEGQITSLLQATLKNDHQEFAVAQVAIHDGLLDMYVRKNSGLIITITAKPLVEDGKLKFETKSFKIGNASLPKYAATLALNTTLGFGASTLEKTLAGFGNLDQVVISEKQVIINFQINK